jgi:hypothetical protein
MARRNMTAREEMRKRLEKEADEDDPRDMSLIQPIWMLPQEET